MHYQCTIHTGVEYGYALPDRDIHDKRATTRERPPLARGACRAPSAPPQPAGAARSKA